MGSPGPRFAAGIVLCLGLAACTTGAAPSADTPPGLQPSGFELRADLVVPPDSHLVGTVFTRPSPVRDGVPGPQVFEQVAYIVSDADIGETAEHLVGQAVDMGPPRYRSSGEESAGPLCIQEGSAPNSSSGKRDVLYVGELDAGTTAVECAWGHEFDPDPSADNWPYAFLLRQEVAVEGSPVLGMIWWTRDVHDLSPLPQPPDDVAAPDVVTNGIAGEKDLPIEPGSLLVGPPWPGTPGSGYTAIIGVTADPDEVFDAYAESAYGQAGQDEFTLGKTHIRELNSSTSGGGFYSLTMNADDDAAWLLITSNYD
jgi:hypothetical protein